MKKYPKLWVQTVEGAFTQKVVELSWVNIELIKQDLIIERARPQDAAYLDYWRARVDMLAWLREKMFDFPERACPWEDLRADFWARFNEEQGEGMTLIQLRQETMEKVCKINQDIKTVLLEQQAAVDNGLLCAEGLLASKLAELLEKRRPLADLVQVLDEIEQENAK